MPKPMLKVSKQQQQSSSGSLLSATHQEENLQERERQENMLIDRLLRKTRSKKYMEALAQLDAGGHVENQKEVEEIIQTIKEEFPELELSGLLLGIVSICYLGEPYEVHSLSIEGNILKHYPRGEAMPGRMEKARGIALRGGYQFIEVYSNCCRAVGKNGSVAVIQG